MTDDLAYAFGDYRATPDYLGDLEEEMEMCEWATQ